MSDSHDQTPSRWPAIFGILVVLAFYFFMAFKLGPENLLPHHGEHSDDHAAADHETGDDAAHGEDHDTESHDPSAPGAAAPSIPHYYAVIPFVLLLGAIAILPLLSATEHWWESNTNRFFLALVLAIVTLIYYSLFFPGGGKDKVLGVLGHAILLEYIPFIVLLFSLYTISGGIRIHGDLIARPLTNVCFLVIGGLLASFVGTTGAAMLLIRPLIETNNERKYVQHTVVFFIFVVCNCGGCLLPIGDPPLFLGYLKGVSFMWTMKHLWMPWLVANSLIILIYFLWDTFYCYPREAKADVRRDIATVRPLTINGLMPNFILLIGVILSVAFLVPGKELFNTGWEPWPFLREAVQLGLVAISLLLGKHEIRENNKFNYHAIIEVAALFIGIFICMQPAIEILNVKGEELGLKTAQQLYWATGALSSALDNAPTYVVFFETAAADMHLTGEQFAQTVSGAPPATVGAAQADKAINLLIGISLGAVFMGSMTYIGNGPNFMVRAIAEQSGVKMPSFFGYVVKYSLPVLIPVFFVIAMLFLR